MLNTEVQGSVAFGRWLRQRRRARDLTQEKLAERVGCALETIRKIESGRRRPSRQMAELMLVALGVQLEDMPSVVDLARLAGEGDVPRSTPGVAFEVAVPGVVEQVQIPSHPRSAGALPSLRTSLVGRAKEREALSTLLMREDVRLLTLHGPPGIGKTKLGVQAGYDLLSCFPDGVFFVPLADVTDPHMMLPEIARLLQLAEMPDRPLAGALKEYLYNKRALLILDNFEQVVAAAPMVSDLLSACPSIKLLVTSRGVLHIAGELELRVSALSLPRSNADLDRESASQYEAVQLFVQRASAVDIGFQLTDESAPVVVEICRRLDALPLAIELAAAWCRVLTPSDIAARVADGFNLLTNGHPDLPPRQQTLGNAIDWSYELLGPAEALLFRRMAVFSGGATVDAVEAVCINVNGGDHALNLLTTLLDAGLLQRAGDRNGASRFSMLTTIRKYAADKLEASGEADAIRQRHAMYYLSRACALETVLTTGHRQAWLDQMEAEHENLRAVLAWCLSEAHAQHQHECDSMGLRIAASLGWFWYFRGYFTEGRLWLDQATRRARSRDDANADVTARAFNALARLAWRQSDYPAVLSAATRSLELARVCGDRVETAHALTMLGITLVRQNNVTGGYLLLEEAVAKFRHSEDEWGLAFGLDHLADATTWRGDYDTATRLYQESLGLFRKLRDPAGVAAELRELGNIALQMKDYGEAVANLEQVLSLDTPAVGQWDRAHSLYSLAYAYQAMHETERSADLYNQALSLFRELGVRLGVAGSLRNLGYLAMDSGDRKAALDLYAQYLDHAQDLNNEYSTLICLAAVAGLLSKCERNEAAIQLLSFVASRCVELKKDLPQVDAALRDTAMRQMRQHTPADVWERCWAQGQAMPIERVFGLAGSELMKAQRARVQGRVERSRP